jgi:hypothetical protein
VFNWEVLIIPLIALAVWILSTIFRNAEEQRQADRPPRPGGTSDGGPPRRPRTELDRFLEEARRRRSMPEQRTENPSVVDGPIIETTPPPPPEPVVIAMPVRPVEPPAPAPARSTRKRERPPKSRAVPTPSVALAVPVEVTPLPEEKAPRIPAMPGPARPVSPLLGRLRVALKDRNTLKTAFVLAEVFGQPISLRRPTPGRTEPPHAGG